jgi:hypothetical protein
MNYPTPNLSKLSSDVSSKLSSDVSSKLSSDVSSKKLEPIVSREEVLLKSLLGFFSVPKHINIVMMIIKSKTNISLRLLDWFPTNYSRYNKILINDTDVYLDYKKQLKSYSKRSFDPFCRRQRIFLNFDLHSIETSQNIDYTYEFIDDDSDTIKEYSKKENGIVTTVGQLNFFRWCIKSKVIDYVFENVQTIEKNMLDMIAKRTNKNSKVEDVTDLKKVRLSRTNGMSKTLVKVTIKFD